MGSRRVGKLLLFAGVASFFLIVFAAGIAFPEEKSRLDSAPDEESSSLFRWIIEANLGREVFFSFSPDLTGMPGLQFDDFRIMENKAFHEAHPYLKPYAIGGDHVSAHVNLLELLLGRITLTDLEVKHPEIQIAIDDKLRTNFDDLIEKQRRNPFINWIRVNQLHVEDTRVNIYTDIIFSKYQQLFLHNIDVDMSNVIKGKIADVSIKAQTPGAKGQNTFLEGTVGPIVSMAAIEQSPMDLKFGIIDAPLIFKDLVQIPPEIEDHVRLKKIIGLPENGVGNMRVTVNGDYEKGMLGEGTIHFKDMYLSNLDNSEKGKCFDAEVRGKGSISMLREEFNIDEIYVSILDSHIRVTGQIKDFLQTDKVKADLKVTSGGMDLTWFQQIYPFYKTVSGIEPIGGNVKIDLDLGGDMEKGFDAAGCINGTAVQLYDRKRDIKGRPLNVSVVLTEKPVYHARKSLLEINRFDVGVGSSHVQAKGRITDYLGEKRRMLATACTSDLNVPEMIEFVPFLKSLVPEGGTSSGFMAFKIDLDTNFIEAGVCAQFDLTNAGFGLKNFAAKEPGSKCIVDIKGTMDLDQISSGVATMEIGKATIYDPYLFTGAFSFLLGDALRTDKGKKIFACVADKKVGFKKATITGTFINGNKYKGDIIVTGINPSTGREMTIQIKGFLELDGFKIDGRGALEMSPCLSREILDISPKAGKFTRPGSEGKIIAVPFAIDGVLTSPKYTFGVSKEEGSHP